VPSASWSTHHGGHGSTACQSVVTGALPGRRAPRLRRGARITRRSRLNGSSLCETGSNLFCVPGARPWLGSPPVTHHLVGAAEVADLLGVSRQQAHRLIRRSDFPAPQARLRSGPVWFTDDVQRWAADHADRRPGRPPRQT
jgi:predicted DNA-binding transcriptional regulator AlpA